MRASARAEGRYAGRAGTQDAHRAPTRDTPCNTGANRTGSAACVDSLKVGYMDLWERAEPTGEGVRRFHCSKLAPALQLAPLQIERGGCSNLRGWQSPRR